MEDMTTTDGLRYIDSDGHILEHPTGMLEYAPSQYRDRIWHVETDAAGREWQCFDGSRRPAVGLSGTAGFSDDEVAKVLRGEIQYSEVRPAAWDAKARLVDMDLDHIDLAVLYPTSLLGLQSNLDVDFGTAQARAYNDWCVRSCRPRRGAPLRRRRPSPYAPPRGRGGGRAGDLPGRRATGNGVGVHAPNPAVEWKQFNDPVYDPIWAAAQETGLPIGLHPFLAPDLPGVCQGLRLGELTSPPSNLTAPNYGESGSEGVPSGGRMSNIYFTQAISNPFDVMSSLCFLTSGGVCERYPDLKLIFLEANGGWLVPWLERLDHHTKKFPLGCAVAQDAPVGVFPSAVLDQLRSRRGHAGHHRIVPARRGRPHHLGLGLSSPGCQVPGRDRGTSRGHGAAIDRPAAPGCVGDRHRPLQHRLSSRLHDYRVGRCVPSDD